VTLAGAGECDRLGRRLVAVDEVADRALQRGGDLQQRGDRGDHVVAFDLVDRGGGDVGLGGKLLERQALLVPELFELRSDGADDAVDVLLDAQGTLRLADRSSHSWPPLTA